MKRGTIAETSPILRAVKFSICAPAESTAALAKNGTLSLCGLARWNLPVMNKNTAKITSDVELPIAAPINGSGSSNSPALRKFCDTAPQTAAPKGKRTSITFHRASPLRRHKISHTLAMINTVPP